MSQKILVDSNIILDIFTADEKWCNWSQNILEKYSDQGFYLCINSIIYSEISISFQRIEELESALKKSEFQILEIPREALFLAGKVFLKYRKNKGEKTSTLPDFFIAAHANILDIPLLTRDKKRAKFYFPSLKVISPSSEDL